MNSRKLSGIVALAVVVCIFGAIRLASAATIDFYLKIEGSKQGQIKGEAAAATGRMPGSQFSYQASESSGAGAGKATERDAQTGKATGNAVATPRDTASGQLVGRRMHGTITIVREIDKASPLLMKAMSSGEVLTSVDLEFVHNGGSESPEVYKTLHMSNVMITSIHPAASSGGDRPSESITFSADTQDIVAKNKAGNKTAMDDWMGAK
jgi:type VI secretion system secreted protein Hcp